MNTEKWVAWAEITASIAVVATLLFLIYEVRQNTLAIERQMRLERQGRLIDPYMASKEFREIYTAIKVKDGQEPRVAAFAEHYSLTPEQAVYWVRHLDQIWTGLEADFLQNGPSRDLHSILEGMLMFPTRGDADVPRWKSLLGIGRGGGRAIRATVHRVRSLGAAGKSSLIGDSYQLLEISQNCRSRTMGNW